MRGVPVDLTDKPVLKRVITVAICNLALVLIVFATGFGQSPIDADGHTFRMRTKRGPVYYRPIVGTYIVGSLLFFIGTGFYTVATARRE